MKDSIEIYQLRSGNQPFIAVFSDPSVKELMGSDTIATPFFGNYPYSKVVEEIAKRNPDSNVTYRGLLD